MLVATHIFHWSTGRIDTSKGREEEEDCQEVNNVVDKAGSKKVIDQIHFIYTAKNCNHFGSLGFIICTERNILCP